MSGLSNISHFQNLAGSGSLHPTEAIMLGLKMAFNAGKQEGFDEGVVVGYALAIEDLKPALSDGLRHRSSECAKAMQNLKESS